MMMHELRTPRAVLGGLVAALICSSAVTARADESDPYQGFLTALATYAASAKDLIASQRTSCRLLALRTALTDQMVDALQQNPKPVIALAKAKINGKDLDEASLLCGFRARPQVLVPQGKLSDRDKNAGLSVDEIHDLALQTYFSLLVSQLQAMAPQPASDVPSAIRQLYTTLSRSAGGQPGSQIDQTNGARDKIAENCEKDLNESDVAYYGRSTAPPAPAAAAEAAATAAAAAGTGIPSLAFLGPYGIAADNVIGILGPIFVDITNAVADSAAKRQIASYLASATVKGEIIKYGNDLGTDVSNYVFAKRLFAAGEFAAELAAIRSMKTDLSKLEECSAAGIMDRSASGPPSSVAFRACYQAVWQKY